MGTNTFNLLIADHIDDAFESIYSTKEPVLLGMGGINDNRIAQPAMERALLTLEKFTQKCDALHVDRKNVKAIGTSALRGASNSVKFIEKVKNLFDIDVRIISGEDEAHFIYQGVKWSHDFSSPAVIMDIGGGSSEFILADANGVKSLVSIDIGVSRIFQLFDHPEYFSKNLQTTILSYFDECAKNRMETLTSSTLIGASGSFETFYEMMFESEWDSNLGVVELPINKLMEQLDWAINSTQLERNNHRWITQIRKTMLPIAALQIIWALQKTKANRVLLSPYSLKEGALSL